MSKPAAAAKTPKTATAAEKTKRRVTYQKAKLKRCDERLKDLNLDSMPLVPPLSKPISYLSYKLDQTRFFFTEIPPDLDWDSHTSIKETFVPFYGYGDWQVPTCLLLDAATPQDKLVILNWWMFMTKQEQKIEYEALWHVYAAPRQSNRRLPPEYFHKMKLLDLKRRGIGLKEPPDTAAEQSAEAVAKVPVKTPPKQRDRTCRGWTGEKYDALFQRCFLEAMTKSRATMAGAARPLDDTIEIPESVSKATGVKDLHFIKEGDDFVLRAIKCTKLIPEKLEKKVTPRRYCEFCNQQCTLVSTMRKHHEKKYKSSADLIEEKNKEMKQLKTQLKNISRRESRRIQRTERDREAITDAANKQKLAALNLAGFGSSLLTNNHHRAHADEVLTDDDEDSRRFAGRARYF